MKEKKLRGEERREIILHLLKGSTHPITGSELAERTNVSRQVIVGDVTLLKAKNEPILATSQGYMYIEHSAANHEFEKIIACCHSPQRTEEELNLLVDHGITVKDVRIEHSVYGDLSASIMVSSRLEVRQFMEKIVTTGASYLSQLTDGIHLHTISASSEEALEQAVDALRNGGFLIEQD